MHNSRPTKFRQEEFLFFAKLKIAPKSLKYLLLTNYFKETDEEELLKLSNFLKVRVSLSNK